MAFLFVMATLVFASDVGSAGRQATPGPVDLVLTDIGFGFERDHRVDMKGTSGYAFTSPFGQLGLTVVDAGNSADARAFLDVFAGSPSPYGGAKREFATPGLDSARGAAYAGPDLPTIYQLVFVAGTLVFSIDLIVEEGAPWDPEFLVLDVARRQVTAAGGPGAPIPAESGTERAADGLLIDEAPDGFGLQLVATVSGANAPGEVREANGPVADVLDRRSVNRTRVWGNDGAGLLAAVSVTRYPYALFAAAGIGALPSDSNARRLARLDDVAGVHATRPVTADGTGERWSVAFRRGRGVYQVAVSANADTPAGAARELARQLTLAQAELAGDGPSAGFTFPSTARSVRDTAVLVAGAGAAAFALNRMVARSARLPVRPLPAPNNLTLDVSRDARTLRRRGYLLLAVQVGCVACAIIGLAAGLGVAGWLLGAGAIVAGVAVTLAWRRKERGRVQRARRVWVNRPTSAATIVGVVAVGLLTSSLALATFGLRELAFAPSLSHLERSDRLSVEPRLLAILVAVAGLGSALVAAVAYRAARARSVARASRLRAVDVRPPVVYLRSFDDDRRRIESVVSARRPFMELFSLRAREPFEEALAWQLSPFGPVVAIERPGTRQVMLGAAREQVPHDRWQAEVQEWMAQAVAIVLVPGLSEGLAWETRTIAALGHLGKTVFVLPPASRDELRQRWRVTSSLLAGQVGVPVGAPIDPAAAITLLVGVDGQALATTGSRRDEASYRAAIDRSMRNIVQRRATHGIGAPVPDRSTR